jgi:hypothetical protein
VPIPLVRTSKDTRSALHEFKQHFSTSPQDNHLKPLPIQRHWNIWSTKPHDQFILQAFFNLTDHHIRYKPPADITQAHVHSLLVTPLLLLLHELLEPCEAFGEVYSAQPDPEAPLRHRWRMVVHMGWQQQHTCCNIKRAYDNDALYMVAIPT